MHNHSHNLSRSVIRSVKSFEQNTGCCWSATRNGGVKPPACSMALGGRDYSSVMTPPVAFVINNRTARGRVTTGRTTATGFNSLIRQQLMTRLLVVACSARVSLPLASRTSAPAPPVVGSRRGAHGDELRRVWLCSARREGRSASVRPPLRPDAHYDYCNRPITAGCGGGAASNAHTHGWNQALH